MSGTGTDVATAAVAELSRLYADGLGAVGNRAHLAVRAMFERKLKDRDFVYRADELTAAIQAAVNTWAAEVATSPAAPSSSSTPEAPTPPSSSSSSAPAVEPEPT